MAKDLRREWPDAGHSPNRISAAPSAPPRDGRNGEAPADPVEEMAAKPPSAQSRPTCPRLAAEVSWLLVML